MSKKKKQKETTIEDYYDLRTDKVDELVEALKGNPTEGENLSLNMSDCMGVTDSTTTKRNGKQKQFDPYHVDRLSRIPAWIKAFFIKFWFAGAVCYFIMWGLQLGDALDSLVLAGVVLGVVTDVLVNPIFRFMQTDTISYNAYMMFPFPFKAFWTFFTNIIYYVIVMFGVMYCYSGINILINLITGTESVIHVGVEPLLFGVLSLIIDMILIGIKDLIVYLVKRFKSKKEEELTNV